MGSRSTNRPHPRTLGLVTGVGLGAGIFYYRSLVEAHLALGLSPRLVMVHADVRRVTTRPADGQAEAEYLAGLLHQLASAGADVGCIPAFGPQVCAAELAELTPLPLISPLDPVVAEVQRQNLRRVSIFGARVTMETALFGKLRNVDVVPPRPDEIAWIDATYAQIVERATGRPEHYETLRTLAHALIAREKLDAILLAGTDLAFVFGPENTDFSHVDGARLHLREIMRQIAQP